MHWSTYIQKQPTGNIILNIFSSEKVMCSKQIFLLSPLATEDVFYKKSLEKFNLFFFFLRFLAKKLFSVRKLP